LFNTNRNAMRHYCLLLLLPLITHAQNTYRAPMAISPLSEFSNAWNDPKYLAGNTAANANYMTAQEKNVIYILNLARMNPKLFCNTVVKGYPERSGNVYLANGNYYSSLLATMNNMAPLDPLQPDVNCYASAQCHALTSGLTDYVGHERKGNCEKKKYYNGECCDYGHGNALDIVLSLLIDYDVPSLGHRDICFTNYKTLGVSIKPHKSYANNAVLDFHY
jgi:hypothetical protein